MPVTASVGTSALAIERRRLIVAWVIVGAVAVAHRVALFLMHRADLDALIAANPTWYTFQYLPAEMLRDHLWRALLLLQQTPPVSNLIMGMVLKWWAWPDGVARVLIGAQTVLSILTAGVLVHLLAMLYPRRIVVWTVAGLLFVLSTDLVVLEYNSMGQSFYGPLGMLATLLVLDALVSLRRTGRLGWAVCAGAATGILLLTRATWYLFPIVTLALVAILAPTRRRRAVLACLVPIVICQGSWALKNYVIYGYLSPATSSWGGLNALAGLRTAGLLGEFEAFRNANGLVRPVPPEVRTRDQAVERRLGLDNPMLNSLAFRVAYADYQRDFIHFARTHPGVILRKWWMAYRVFWQPIANYGSYFVALFAVSNRITDPFDFGDIVRQLRAGTLPDAQYVVRGTFPSSGRPDRFTPTTLYTAALRDPLLLMVEIVGLHLLAPLVGFLWCADRLRRGWWAPPLFEPLRMTALLAGGVLYGYFAGLVNLVETGENLRYRLEIEPVIWVIVLVAAGELWRLCRRSRPRRTPAGDVAREPCDLCGGAAWRAYARDNPLGLVECERCGLVSVGSIPPAHDLHALYDKSYFESDDRGPWGTRTTWPTSATSAAPSPAGCNDSSGSSHRAVSSTSAAPPASSCPRPPPAAGRCKASTCRRSPSPTSGGPSASTCAREASRTRRSRVPPTTW